MSDPKTQFLTNDSLTRKRWARDLFQVVLPNVEFNDLIGSGSDAIVQTRTELGKGEGDNVKFGIRLPLTGEGVVGNDTLEGNEEKLRFRDFSMTIEELNHAVDTGGRMEEQRVPYNLMQEGKNGLQDWWSQKLSDILVNTLAGNSAYRVAGKVFAQAITEPDALHLVTPASKAESALTVGDEMTLDVLDKMKQQAELMNKLGGYKIRGTNKGGKTYYHVLMHNYVFDKLRQNVNIGQWGDLLRSAGKLGMPQVELEYNGLLIRRSERLPMVYGADGAGSYRTLLLGAQSACFAWGGAGESKSTTMSFTPYTRDAERFVMVRGGGIFGIKKTQFDTGGAGVQDYGCMVCSTYATPLSA